MDVVRCARATAQQSVGKRIAIYAGYCGVNFAKWLLVLQQPITLSALFASFCFSFCFCSTLFGE